MTALSYPMTGRQRPVGANPLIRHGAKARANAGTLPALWGGMTKQDHINAADGILSILDTPNNGLSQEEYDALEAERCAHLDAADSMTE